jgi:hypothetical protein
MLIEKTHIVGTQFIKYCFELQAVEKYYVTCDLAGQKHSFWRDFQKVQKDWQDDPEQNIFVQMLYCT